MKSPKLKTSDRVKVISTGKTGTIVYQRHVRYSVALDENPEGDYTDNNGKLFKRMFPSYMKRELQLI